MDVAGPCAIFVLDEDASVRFALEAAIDLIEADFRVQHFTDGFAALAAAVKRAPALVLVDECLPGFPGDEWARQFNALLPDAGAVIRRMGMRQRDSLRRPLSLDELVDLVQQATGAPRRLPPPSLLSLCGSLTDGGWTLSEVQLGMLRNLERISALRDEPTGLHTARVARYAACIARAHGLNPEQQDALRLAAPLHDIGNLIVPDAVLQKNGRLTAEEFEMVKAHAVAGSRLLAEQPGPLFALAAEVALGHHERWDGQGYPYGRSGADIPLSARIVAIADAFDMASSTHGAEGAVLLERGLMVVREGAGHAFDPDLVADFLGAVREIAAIKRHFDGASGFRELVPQPNWARPVRDADDPWMSHARVIDGRAWLAREAGER